MGSNTSLLTPALSFARDLWWRAQIRLLVLRAGVLSGGIWTAALLGAAWLYQLGYGVVVPWLFAIWLITALPVMYLDLALILDMVGYAFTGRVSFFPTLIALSRARTLAERNSLSNALAPSGFAGADLSERGERTLKRLQSSRTLHAVLAFIDASSPFACLALWAMVVLSRIPKSAHRLLVAADAREMKLEVDRGVYGRTLSRWSA